MLSTWLLLKKALGTYFLVFTQFIKVETAFSLLMVKGSTFSGRRSSVSFPCITTGLWQ